MGWTNSHSRKSPTCGELASTGKREKIAPDSQGLRKEPPAWNRAASTRVRNCERVNKASSRAYHHSFQRESASITSPAQKVRSHLALYKLSHSVLLPTHPLCPHRQGAKYHQLELGTKWAEWEPTLSSPTSGSQAAADPCAGTITCIRRYYYYMVLDIWFSELRQCLWLEGTRGLSITLDWASESRHCLGFFWGQGLAPHTELSINNTVGKESSNLLITSEIMLVQHIVTHVCETLAWDDIQMFVK